MKNTILLLFLLLFSVNLLAEPRIRPENWAKSVINSKVDNLFKVDEKLYRSAQPNHEGMVEMERFGIKNILNLRDYHSDKDEITGTTLKLNEVEMNAAYLKIDELVEAIKIIRDSKGPVLVHCKHGADRTGAVVALYRILFNGWTREEAIDELLHGGFGFHTVFSYMTSFLKNIDLEKFKELVND